MEYDKYNRTKIFDSVTNTIARNPVVRKLEQKETL